ncbi:hypothetical protein LUZ60_014468 [Juncus effusus]|nr:hypothetical protein LUZ60_014468 [Juncus effusus]
MSVEKPNSKWLIFAILSIVLGFDPWRKTNLAMAAEQERLLVGMTLLPQAVSAGAVCLDGSPPAYHLHRGFSQGKDNWLLQFEGGGWCNDVKTCQERAGTRRGSTRYMNRLEVFSGILSNDPAMNPDFYNWNRVKLRYCDGGSFTGDSEYKSGNNTLFFRGQRIFDAIIDDLLPKGLAHANMVLLSGCSAGGLSVFHHCDDLAHRLADVATVKCMSDAGFFLDLSDITGNNNIRPFYSSLVSLHNTQKVLNKRCMASFTNPSMCFFPQYALAYIQTPFFVLNSAYDTYQFHHSFVPPSADLLGHWKRCKSNPELCSKTQIEILQGMRAEMIKALGNFNKSANGGMYINSCFQHCQSELQIAWFTPSSPKVHNKRIAEAVGDWYFGRGITKDVDCPYPCDSTCYKSATQAAI